VTVPGLNLSHRQRDYLNSIDKATVLIRVARPTVDYQITVLYPLENRTRVWSTASSLSVDAARFASPLRGMDYGPTPPSYVCTVYSTASIL